MKPTDYVTVTGLTKYLKRKFDADPYLDIVYLTGEISNFRPRAGAHQYFSLKDDKAKISAVMFKMHYQKLKFQPEEGMKVLVIGRISLYEPSGSYQINIEHMEPDGIGALYQAYEKLKGTLEQEGLFKTAHKQTLVKYPKKIAVVTSPSGAVIQDIITTLKRRYPIAQIVVFPSLVQGAEASKALVCRIKQVDQMGGFDTMIVARGGGSIEDLWPFNTEEVVRAVFEARTPVISSIGHETDTTLTDLVADVRAATPTAAAEMSAPVLNDEMMYLKQKDTRLILAYESLLKQKRHQLIRASESVVLKQPQRLYEAFYLQLDHLDRRLNQGLIDVLSQNQSRLERYKSRLDQQNPTREISSLNQRLSYQTQRLIQLMDYKMEQSEQRFVKATESLDLLSPLKTMTRGYSYTTQKQNVLTSISQVDVNDSVDIHLTDGVLKATITDIKEGEQS